MLRRNCKCEMCDKTVVTLSARSWCIKCEDEFEHIRVSRFAGCKDCITPVSCVTQRRCLKEPDRPVQHELFAKEY